MSRSKKSKEEEDAREKITFENYVGPIAPPLATYHPGLAPPPVFYQPTPTFQPVPSLYPPFSYSYPPLMNGSASYNQVYLNGQGVVPSVTPSPAGNQVNERITELSELVCQMNDQFKQVNDILTKEKKEK